MLSGYYKFPFQENTRTFTLYSGLDTIISMNGKTLCFLEGVTIKNNLDNPSNSTIQCICNRESELTIPENGTVLIAFREADTETRKKSYSFVKVGKKKKIVFSISSNSFAKSVVTYGLIDSSTMMNINFVLERLDRDNIAKILNHIADNLTDNDRQIVSNLLCNENNCVTYTAWCDYFINKYSHFDVFDNLDSILRGR